MRKAKKILRKLLSAFRDEIASKPITKERNSLVDSATFLIEAIGHEERANLREN